MNAPTNPKRNHHYVWKAYLNSWATDKRVWRLENNNIDLRRTKHVAFEKDFYKLEELTVKDFELLEWFISHGSPYAQRTNRDLLKGLMEPYKLFRKIPNPNLTITEFIKRYSYETLEDYHSTIENSFSPFLKRALNDDIDFFNGQDSIVFLNYLCTQLTRTKKFKENVISTIEKLHNADFSRIWSILIHMFATNIGGSIYAERKNRKLQLLKNSSSCLFVTSDAPVINLKSDGGKTPPTQVAMYYPISPTRALYISEVDECFDDINIKAAEAEQLNERIHKNAYAQTFAEKKSDLEKFIK